MFIGCIGGRLHNVVLTAIALNREKEIKMAMDIDPDSGEEYEVTEEDIIREERYRERRAKMQQEQNLPAFTYGVGIDGHSYAYHVVGTYPDGTLRTSSFDAIHQDTCACYDPGKWY